MAAIGQLAAGVAHEINNPIGFVNSNLGTLKNYVERLLGLIDAYDQCIVKNAVQSPQLAAAKQEADLGFLRDDIVALLGESRDGLDRVKKIVQDLKDFSHIDEAELQEADLNAGIESTLNVVWNELKYKADVVKEYGQLPPVRCIPGQLNQVFMNLLINAAQAIDQHGTITVRSGTKGDQVWIEVVDSGRGMPPEVKKRMFEPFFTTKPVGKGTGLGLSLSYDIVVKKHDGRFEVDSEPGKGSTFRVWLPVGGPRVGAV
jgi:signal transduction histidine kinase